LAVNAQTDHAAGDKGLTGEDRAGEIGDNWAAGVDRFESMVSAIGDALLARANFLAGERVLEISPGGGAAIRQPVDLTDNGGAAPACRSTPARSSRPDAMAYQPIGGIGATPTEVLEFVVETMPVGNGLAGCPEETQEAARKQLLEVYVAGQGVVMPCKAWLVSSITT
jgi:hypothetical protein